MKPCGTKNKNLVSCVTLDVLLHFGIAHAVWSYQYSIAVLKMRAVPEMLAQKVV